MPTAAELQAARDEGRNAVLAIMRAPEAKDRPKLALALAERGDALEAARAEMRRRPPETFDLVAMARQRWEASQATFTSKQTAPAADKRFDLAANMKQRFTGYED